METDLHSILTSASNCIKSTAEVEAHRKVDLEDKKIKEETRQEFNKLWDRFDDIISKGSDDIGKTLLVEMDIDTGDSPPIASKPYTLSLKHYDWVQKEITTLEKAGIITKSISPWALPVVIVPKEYKRNRQNDSFRNNKSWNSPRNNNPNFRKINKYKHHTREPRNNIKYE